MLTAGRMEREIKAGLDESAWGVAMICTVPGEGGTEGATYAPVEEIVPQAAPAHPVAQLVPVQPVPATLQVMARLGFELGDTVSVAA